MSTEGTCLVAQPQEPQPPVYLHQSRVHILLGLTVHLFVVGMPVVAGAWPYNTTFHSKIYLRAMFFVYHWQHDPFTYIQTAQKSHATVGLLEYVTCFRTWSVSGVTPA